jgi:hypothetical protein
MESGSNNGQSNERSLIKLYMDLMGTTESRARSVFIYVSAQNGKGPEVADEYGLKAVPGDGATWRSADARFSQLQGI